MKKGFFIALLTILTLSFAPDLFAAASGGSADIDAAAVDLTKTTKAVGSLFGWVVAFAGGIFAFLGIGWSLFFCFINSFAVLVMC